MDYYFQWINGLINGSISNGLSKGLLFSYEFQFIDKTYRTY